MAFNILLRIVGAAILALLAWQAGTFATADKRYLFLSLVCGAVLGLAFTPWAMKRPYLWFRRRVQEIPAPRLLVAGVGLAAGLALAVPLAVILALLPAPWGKVMPFAAALVVSYLSVAVAVIKGEDFLEILGIRPAPEEHGPNRASVLVDTSVIIDGRIADISRAGFITGTILIPRFVLRELQHIADSPDALRRNRGRRGLDMLNRLRKEAGVPIHIADMDVPSVEEVDGKLIALAKKLGYPVVTNDYNLNQIAELQGVKVLNVNELANAVRPKIFSGEPLSVRLCQEGTEPGQGVGYLDDGTMVVVQEGRRRINSTVQVVVSRVLQTGTGRIIFAELEDRASG